jgi:hypothetical protein
MPSLGAAETPVLKNPSKHSFARFNDAREWPIGVGERRRRRDATLRPKIFM